MTWRVEKDVGGFPVRRSDEAAARYLAGGYWRDETLTDVARVKVEEDPDRLLLVEGEHRLTRGLAWEQARRLAAFFLSRGLAPGDVVSFQLPNWVEAAVVALAARMCGLIINPVTPIYREAELSYILADCGSKLIFTPGVFRKWDHLAAVEKVRGEAPSLRDVVTVRADAAEGARRFEDILAAHEPVDLADLPEVDPAAAMMVMYTAGTTSRPKGVVHSHQTFGNTAWRMIDIWGITEKDVFFMPSPLTHITGAFWSFDMPWLCGASNVLMDVWTPEEGVDAIAANGCTISGGATPFLQQLLNVGRKRPEAVKSLRYFFCGGTTVSPDLVKEAAATFPNCLFWRGYGCTESPCTTMGIRGRDYADLGAETDGEVMAPTEVRMLTPDGDGEVPEGEEGEIAVRGPEQFLGYLHPEDNAAVFDDEGFFRTGDLGRRVHGDYLVITGRKKDIIIRNGENISPKEVEDILYLHPDIVEAAIVAMPSPTTGEKGCAFIIPRPGAVVDMASVSAFLAKSGLARQKFPEHLVIVDDLPRVPSGKVKKDVLRLEARKIAETEQGR
jgi:acyl-CoA synthetase (AMP-forming)/AMP-acid ligase II